MVDGFPELLVTTADLHFLAPDTVAAGLTRVRMKNTSTEEHHVQLIRIEEGHTFDEFRSAVMEGRFAEPWMIMVGGPNAPPAGGSSETIVELEPGLYGMICFVPGADGVAHVMKGMVRSLAVVPNNGAPAAEPAVDGTLALDEYSFAATPALPAGRSTIRVENAGAQPHEVFMARLGEGKTLDDALAWMANMSQPAPIEFVGGTTVIAPGRVNYLVLDLPPGEYILVCFVPDVNDGRGHLRHGMVEQVSVQ